MRFKYIQGSQDLFNTNRRSQDHRVENISANFTVIYHCETQIYLQQILQ